MRRRRKNSVRTFIYSFPSPALPPGDTSSHFSSPIASESSESVDLGRRGSTDVSISEGTISKASQAKSYFEERYRKGGDKIKDGRKSYRLTVEESKKLAESLGDG